MSVFEQITKLSNVIHNTINEAGWWTDLETGEDLHENPYIPFVKLNLVHAEISEATEAKRKDLMDSHLPHRRGDEVELADAIIRILDYCGAYNLDIGGAIVEKLEYNKHRKDHKVDNRLREGGKSV